VENNKINDESAKALAQNKTLTSLNVYCNFIGAEGAKALAQNKTLTSLNVGYNKIGDEGAKALAQNTTLTSLDVSLNQISDEGAKALAQNTTLTWLNVYGNGLARADEKVIEASLARNRKQRENWLRLAPLMAFVRANRSSAIKTSFLPLVSLVAKLEDESYTDKQTYHIHLDKFFDTRFFKQQISEEKCTWWNQRKPVASAEEKSEKISTNRSASAAVPATLDLLSAWTNAHAMAPAAAASTPPSSTLAKK
jgi:hypothetical protein